MSFRIERFCLQNWCARIAEFFDKLSGYMADRGLKGFFFGPFSIITKCYLKCYWNASAIFSKWNIPIIFVFLYCTFHTTQFKTLVLTFYISISGWSVKLMLYRFSVPMFIVSVSIDCIEKYMILNFPLFSITGIIFTLIQSRENC